MFCVGERIEIKGYIGESFLATIDGSLVSMPINVETKHGIITEVIPGPCPGTEFLYMIKFMNFQFPMKVDEDYVMKDSCC